jgi:hypothetical protein
MVSSGMAFIAKLSVGSKVIKGEQTHEHDIISLSFGKQVKRILRFFELFRLYKISLFYTEWCQCYCTLEVRLVSMASIFVLLIVGHGEVPLKQHGVHTESHEN